MLFSFFPHSGSWVRGCNGETIQFHCYSHPFRFEIPSKTTLFGHLTVAIAITTITITAAAFTRITIATFTCIITTVLTCIITAGTLAVQRLEPVAAATITGSLVDG